LTSLLFLVLLAGDLEAAEQALRAGKPQEAIRLLGDLAERDDAGWRENAVLGRAHLALGEYEAAVEPLLRASEARSNDKALARDAAWACWGSAQGVYARAYLDDALRMARRAEDPRLIADIAFEAGDYEEALSGYEGLLSEVGDRLTVLDRIAESHSRLGHEERAREAYGAVLEEAIARGELLAAYRSAFAAGRPGRLVQWLDGRIVENEDDVWSRLYRGYALFRLLQYGKASEDLRIAARARPDDTGLKSHLCRALIRVGMDEQRPQALEEGESVAREVLANDPRDQGAWDALRWLAWHHWMARGVPRCHAILRHLHQVDPEDFDVGMNYAAMARRLGFYEESETAYKALLEAFPDDPAVLNDLGILRDGMGDRKRAVALWKRALSEDPSDLNALENLFTAAWERGQREAMEDYLARGLAAARAARNGPVERWIWFGDRLLWAPSGHGG
jgi:tetratricopeptide (TPR) repeat protein